MISNSRSPLHIPLCFETRRIFVPRLIRNDRRQHAFSYRGSRHANLSGIGAAARTNSAASLRILTGPTIAEPPTRPVLRRSPSTNDMSMHRQALEATAPPSIMIDETHQIVTLSETAGRFLLHSGGPMTSEAPDIVRPELRLDLRAGLHRAFSRTSPRSRCRSCSFQRRRTRCKSTNSPCAKGKRRTGRARPVSRGGPVEPAERQPHHRRFRIDDGRHRTSRRAAGDARAPTGKPRSV